MCCCDRYQGQKNCIHLISQELEGEFTAAQIGQRLLLLGCDKSKKRKQKPACQSIDDNDDPCKEVHHSLGREDGGDKDADHMRDFMDVGEDLAGTFLSYTQPRSLNILPQVLISYL